jgi:hypothetical protein
VKQHLVNLDKQHTPEMDREHMGQDLKRQIDTAKTLAKCLDAIQKKAVLHFHVCIMVRDHEVGLATTDPPYDYGNNSDRDRTK